MRCHQETEEALGTESRFVVKFYDFKGRLDGRTDKEMTISTI